MSKQKELFDGFLRLRNCRKCERKLHIDRKAKYATREAGLCYACLREFEVSPFWTVDKFIEESKRTNGEPFIMLMIDADTESWLKSEAKRLKMSVDDVVLQIVETRRLTEVN